MVRIKKILAFLLAASMVFSMLSMTALAAENPADPIDQQEETAELESEDQVDNKNIDLDSVSDMMTTALEDEDPDQTGSPAPEPTETAPQSEVPNVSGAKFAVVVSSELSDGSTTYVYGTVGADYQAKLVLPGPASNSENSDALAKVNAGNATIGIYMNGVEILGGGSKSYVKTIETGVDAQTTIANNASQLYEFKGTTIIANIKDGDTTKSVTYTLSPATAENGNTVINGTADTDAARAAWQLMTGNITAGSKTEDDSFIVIAPNSWLQIGNDVLVFEEGQTEALKLDNITAGNLANLNAQIRQAVKLTTADSSGLSFCLGKGTQLALSNSSAELTKDVVVTVSGADMAGLNSVLSGLQGGVGEDGKDVIMQLLGLMNTALEAVQSKSLTVDIVFGEEETEQPEEPVVEDAPKFKVEVSSVLNDGSTTTVTGTVDADYNAKLVIPNAPVNAGNVTISVSMNDVGSLGGGNKNHSMTLGTGATAECNLFTALNGLSANALRDFKDATINATIKSDDDTKEVTYTLTGSKWEDDCIAKIITGMTDTEAARAAWALMVNDKNFTVGTQAADSKIVIANGSSLQIGTELLVFEDNYTGDLVLDNIASMNVEDITNAVKLTTADESAFTFTLKKGTTLAVSSSYATLNKDVVVTIKGADLTDLTVLSEIKAAVNNGNMDATGMIKSLIDMMNTAISLVDNAENVNVTIEFTCAHELTKTDAKDATCTEAGNKAYWTCSVCGKVFSDEACTTETTVDEMTIEALGHEMQEVADSVKAATCTEAGKKADTKCSRCKETETGAEIAATGHTWGEWTVTTPATAGNAGAETRACNRCSETETREIPALTTPVTPDTPSIPSRPSNPSTPPEQEIEDPETPLVEKPFLFADVTEKDWFYDDVKKAFNLDLMVGVSDTIFNPYADSTRAMVAQVLYRLSGKPSIADYDVDIPDVKETDWFYDAAVWAYANGVYKGYEDGTFRGEKEITREELAAVLLRYSNVMGYDVTETSELSAFADKVAVSSWAESSVQWAVGAGMLKGRAEDRLVPEGQTTRAELATVLVRYTSKYMPEKVNPAHIA